MLRRPAVIPVLVGFACMAFGVSCQTSSPPTPTSTISPAPSLTTDFVLTNTPISFPTIALTKTPVLPSPIPCPWIPYLNGESASSLSSENCLNDLGDIGISGDSKKISFFVDGASTGTYGVCRDISEKDNVKFSVAVRDNITSARFLITVGPDPVPTKTLSRAFSVHPEASEEMYVKFIKYASTSKADDYPMEVGKIQAILDWKQVHDWGFDFVFEFSSSKVTASMNKALFEQWQLNSPSRYLCFAYQATPTTQTTELEAQVNFP